MRHDLVLYHARCNDGMCAAAIAYSKLTCLTIAVKYQEPLPKDIYKATAIYIVDFSYPLEQLIELDGLGVPITIIDHHKTAQESLYAKPWKNINVIFDLNKSGAKLTWDFFYPKRRWTPLVVRLVQDRDLWNFDLELTKGFHAYTNIEDNCIQDWITWLGAKGETIQQYAQQGELILKRESQLHWELYEQLTKITPWRDYIISLTPCPGSLMSDFSYYVLEENSEVDFAVTWFILDNGDYKYSLRSRSPAMDVSVIAKDLGGGGHPEAAGVTSDTPEFIF